MLPGGGVALLYASRELDKLPTSNSDQLAGVQIVKNSLKVPKLVILDAFSSEFVKV